MKAYMALGPTKRKPALFSAFDSFSDSVSHRRNIANGAARSRMRALAERVPKKARQRAPFLELEIGLRRC